MYVRLGSTSRPAGPELLAELQRTHTGLSFDLPEPEWQELGAAVRVVFRPHPDVEQMNDDTVNTANDPVNDPLNDPLNKRQKWYLEWISCGVKAKAADLVQHWSVSPVTAKRDISDLKERGLIEFIGSTKTGWYRKK